MSVDLPAPFSPSRMCTSPRRREKSTPSSATTPGKVFLISRISRTGASAVLSSWLKVEMTAYKLEG